MTGASKVTGSSVPNMNDQDRVADRDRKEIDRKHKHHHNHLGVNLSESERKRLKKLFLQFEKMLTPHDDAEGDPSDSLNKNDVHKLIQDHVKNSVRNLRDQYGINDEKLNHIHNLKEADNALATQGDIVLSGGIAVLYLFMNLLSDLAQYKYLEMQQKAKVSRDAQDMANRVQEQIADVSKGKDPDTAKVSLDPDVIKYMEANDVKIDGKTIDEYLNEKGDSPTDLTLKSSDAKQSLHVYQKDGQWYMEDKDPSQMGTMGMMGGMNLPSKISAPTFKDGKVTLTIDDKHQFSNPMAYMVVQNQIKKAPVFQELMKSKATEKLIKVNLMLSKRHWKTLQTEHQTMFHNLNYNYRK